MDNFKETNETFECRFFETFKYQDHIQQIKHLILFVLSKIFGHELLYSA